MTRDRQFIIDSIKMDLFRVITATGNLNKKISKASILTFLEHADKDFDKIRLNPHEKEIRNKLSVLAKDLPNLSDPKARLRWTEDVMTARCML